MRRLLSIIVLCVLAVSVLTGANWMPDYAKAKAAHDKGKPLVLLLAADWCQYCPAMHKRLDEAWEARPGEFVLYAVDVDKEPELARQLMVGGSIPQVVVYRKDSFRRAAGVQSKAATLELIFGSK